MKEILVIGGGFAGMWAALAAAREASEHEGRINITLAAKDGYLGIRPRFYEKDPESLRVPLRPVLDPVGVTLVEGTAGAIDTAARTVAFDVGAGGNGGDITLDYDRLVLAAGSVLRELPAVGAGGNTWNIDTYAAAVALDRHLQELMTAPGTPGHNTVVIVGSGLTGIELATEMRARLAAHGDEATAAAARVVLVERAEIVGPDIGDAPRPIIEDALQNANVETRLGVEIVEAGADHAILSDGERIDTATIVVTAGLRANPLADTLPVERDELGRLPVDETLRVKGLEGIYAAGDIARAYVDEVNLAVMSCQHGMAMGRFAGYNAARDLLGLSPQPYRQPNYVTCFDLGESGALFTTGWDRDVSIIGAEAKELKRTINTKRIYPPTGSRREILEAARID